MKKTHSVLFIVIILIFTTCQQKSVVQGKMYRDFVYIVHAGDWIMSQYTTGIAEEMDPFDPSTDEMFTMRDTCYTLYKITSFVQHGSHSPIVYAIQFDTLFRTHPKTHCNIDTSIILRNCNQGDVAFYLNDNKMIITKILPCDTQVNRKYHLKFRIQED